MAAGADGGFAACADTCAHGTPKFAFSILVRVPSSAISVAYSLSKVASVGAGWARISGLFFWIQSRATCPIPLHILHTRFAVKLLASGHSHLRCPRLPQLVHICASSSRRVPLRAASSRS